MKKVRERLKCKRKSELRRQFQDMIDSLASALTAGYSIEKSFYEAHRDMLKLYGRDSLITRELEYFFSMLEAGTQPEVILSDFAKRADVEDITDFSEIFILAKRNGGDFNGIIRKTVNMMKEKDETEKEIQVILTGRKYEQKLMCIIPLGIILYLRISSGDFMSVLYHNGIGIAVMTLCLSVYIASYLISGKMIDIRV
jgi:tight adherence protein B